MHFAHVILNRKGRPCAVPIALAIITGVRKLLVGLALYGMSFYFNRSARWDRNLKISRVAHQQIFSRPAGIPFIHNSTAARVHRESCRGMTAVQIVMRSQLRA
jgi:hypothetical protein